MRTIKDVLEKAHKKRKLTGRLRNDLFSLSISRGLPKVYTLLGGEELEEWKACTFLLDGIRLPISGAGGNWKIIPHFPGWNKTVLYRLRGGKGDLTNVL